MAGAKYIIPEPDGMVGESGWTSIEMPRWNLAGSSFIEGDPDGQRLRIRMYVRDTDNHLIAKVWFGPEAEGPPGHAHGGAMAAVLDHVMGISAWVSGHPVVARKVGFEFHRKLPLGTVALAEAWVSDVQDKKVTTEGRLYFPEPSDLFASSDGLFIKQSLDKFRALLEVHSKTEG